MFHGLGFVNFDGRKGIVVASDNLIALDKITGNGCIFVSHGKIIANGQNSDVQFGTGHGYQFHILGQGRIARMVDAMGVIIEHKTARISTVASVGQHARMDSAYIFCRSKIEGILSAMVHSMSVNPLFGEPADHFKVGNQLRLWVVLCNGLHIEYMVLVTMGHKNIIDL